MSIIKKIILKSLIILFLNSFSAFSNEVQKVGKFKDWDVMVLTNQTEKICFAQSKPVLQSPKKKPKRCETFCEL